MIRAIKRGFAIQSYVWKLSQKLDDRYGRKPSYSYEQVTKTAQEGGFSRGFMAYAHAMFCTRAEFDRHYGPLRVACTYDGSRAEIGRRYFSGSRNFTAATIIRATKPPREEGYSFHQGSHGE